MGYTGSRWQQEEIMISARLDKYVQKAMDRRPWNFEEGVNYETIRELAGVIYNSIWYDGNYDGFHGYLSFRGCNYSLVEELYRIAKFACLESTKYGAAPYND